MKFAKSILLASATAFASFAASAADLPKKSAPAPVCAYGAGFFMIPGTAQCIKIGGFVRAEYAIGASQATNGGGATWGILNGAPGVATAGQNTYGFGSRFFLDADVRSASSYGLVRSYGRFFGSNGITSAYATPGAAPGTVGVLEAFVQFAGITAGYALSNFGFYNNDWNFGSASTLSGAHDYRNNMLAYTASLGSGLTATVALEDGAYRRFNGVTANNNLVTPQVSGALAQDAAYATGANRTPDVVANINYTQGWGSAQVMAAYHNNVSATGHSANGYAVGAGVKVNVGSSGSQAILQGQYGVGANAYVLRPVFAGTLNNIGASWSPQDGYANGTATGISLTKSYSVLGGYNHIWSSAFRTSLVGGYQNVNSPDSSVGGAAIADSKSFNVAFTNVWTAAPGLTVGLELFMDQTKFSQSGAVALPNTAVTDAKSTGVTLRVQRAF